MLSLVDSPLLVTKRLKTMYMIMMLFKLFHFKGLTDLVYGLDPEGLAVYFYFLEVYLSLYVLILNKNNFIQHQRKASLRAQGLTISYFHQKTE